ncbi:RNA polymerase sigma factor [Alkalihalobacillus sp. 1P02AB]|uniref:RNA polymerase sigma factor n=1 Tax=Alkalihalobacillus sp. 1P02AB TaxID=3132260 RepID=UPI0039A566BD
MEDEALVKQILAGDDQALRMLYERYFQPIFQYAFIQTGNYHDAEEITQDIFSKMARNLHTFKQDSSFKTWLYSIGRNVVIDHHRKQKRHKQVIPVPGSDMEAIKRESVQTAKTNKRLDEVLAYLSQLPDDYRTVIQLRFIDNFTLQETAHIMKKTLLSVKSLQHRAKKQLTAAVEKGGL